MHTTTHSPQPDTPNAAEENAIAAPIGVFDSGIGGLSILRSLTQAMPGQRFIYLGDTAYAPYGERDDAYVIDRSRRIAQWMHDEQHTAGLVIACNTATAIASKVLREGYGDKWPIVGVEPGIKPAAQLSKSGRIGIMATANTLKSAKYQTLIRRIHDNTQMQLQIYPCACDGLAQAIEHHQTELIKTLVERYTTEIKKFSPDVVVLGCTHYPLVKELITQVLPGIEILDTGEAVARHTKTVFAGKTNKAQPASNIATLDAWTNSQPELLQSAINRWLPDTAVQMHRWN